MDRPVPGDAVTINFLDVGQGAATLIVDHASRKALLIDCPAGREDVVEGVLDRYSAELDVAMITHFDEDHLAGVVTLIETRSCRQLVTRVNVGYRTETDLAQHRRVLARVKRGLNFEAPRRHDGGFLGDSPGRVRWRVLSPDAVTDLTAYSAESRNRVSLVLRLEVRPLNSASPAHHFVVAGDADGPVWRRLLAYGDDLSCYALLWPHHGGKLGTMRSPLRRDLLAACNPKIVVVSAGSRNGHRHPAQSTLEAIRESRARLMCTEVTERCHSLAMVDRGLACSGNVELQIDASGGVHITPSVVEHRRVINAWDRPQCATQSFKIFSSEISGLTPV